MFDSPRLVFQMKSKTALLQFRDQRPNVRIEHRPDQQTRISPLWLSKATTIPVQILAQFPQARVNLEGVVQNVVEEEVEDGIVDMARTSKKGLIIVLPCQIGQVLGFWKHGMKRNLLVVVGSLLQVR